MADDLFDEYYLSMLVRMWLNDETEFFTAISSRLDCAIFIKRLSL